MENPQNIISDRPLRDQLDDSRLELQKLQDEMEERQSVFRLAKTLARRLLKEPWCKLTGHYRRKTHRDDHLLQTKSFKPYRLNYRNPPGNRPCPVVVHVIGNFCVGGLSRLLVDIIERTSDDYDHVVLTLQNPQPPAFLGVKIEEVEEKTSARDFTRRLAAYKPAIIHVHHYAPHSLHHVWLWYRTAILAAASLEVPIIEGVNVPMTPYHHPAVRAYVFVSRYVQDSFGFAPSPNRVIYPGSDFSVFEPKPHQFTDTIGMVYRLDESKLRKESIDVFIRVLQTRASTRAIIVGDGPLLAHYQQQVAKAGLTDRFTFTGYVAYDQLPAYYNRMDVFVAPIFCESFGQVTTFAMNMGIPVAAYAAGALPEILDDLSVVAPPGEAEALAGIILSLLSDPDRSAVVAQKNQVRAREVFSVEAMVREYATLYSTMRQGGAKGLNPEKAVEQQSNEDTKSGGNGLYKKAIQNDSPRGLRPIFICVFASSLFIQWPFLDWIFNA